jgi:hypothetical protein
MKWVPLAMLCCCFCLGAAAPLGECSLLALREMSVIMKRLLESSDLSLGITLDILNLTVSWITNVWMYNGLSASWITDVYFGLSVSLDNRRLLWIK